MQAANQELTDELASLEQRHAELTAEFQEAVISCDQSQESNESLTKQLEEAEAYSMVQATEMTSMRSDLEARQASIDRWSEDKAAIQAQLDTAQKTLQQLDPLQAQLAEQHSQIKKHEQEKAEAAGLLDNMHRQHADMQSKLRASVHELEEKMNLEAQIKEANEKFATLVRACSLCIDFDDSAWASYPYDPADCLSCLDRCKSWALFCKLNCTCPSTRIFKEHKVLQGQAPCGVVNNFLNMLHGARQLLSAMRIICPHTFEVVITDTSPDGNTYLN